MIHVALTINRKGLTDPRTLVKSVYQKNNFLISQPKTYVVDTQKNLLNETVLLSNRNIC